MKKYKKIFGKMKNIKKYLEKWQKKYFFGILYAEEMMCDELEIKFVQIAQRGV